MVPTYQANPYPTTAQNGRQGAFGAMLPQVNVGSPSPNNIFAPAVKAGAIAGPFQPDTRRPIGVAGLALGIINPQAPAPLTTYSSQAAMPDFLRAQNVGVQGVPVYSASQGHPDPGLFQRIAQNPQEFENLNPAQKEAVERLLIQGTSQADTSQRLDASGNVWDPATAQTDIYGGKFIQEGETRWERNRHGRLVKVQYMSGNRKRIVSGGKGQGKSAKQTITAQEQQTTSGFVSSFGVVNFNTATG